MFQFLTLYEMACVVHRIHLTHISFLVYKFISCLLQNERLNRKQWRTTELVKQFSNNDWSAQKIWYEWNKLLLFSANLQWAFLILFQSDLDSIG